MPRVVPFYLRFVERWPTAADLAARPPRRRARRVARPRATRAGRGTCTPPRGVVAERGWPPPDRLTDLPGVGPYTAAALRCFADGEDVLPLDTNAARVVARRFPGGWPGAAGRGLGGRARR